MSPPYPRPQTVTADDYARIFADERRREYPVIDALEDRLGFAIDRAQLEEMARVLACPLKANPPNWQHGRVLYAVARACFARHRGVVHVVDIGTAKGFSALCLQMAIEDSGVLGSVVSIDVIDPVGREMRNSVLELDGPKTIGEFLAPWWRIAKDIRFVKSTGRDWLTANTGRVHFAFVDGKHAFEAVSWEAALLAARQQSGDVIVFDDVQIPGVAKAVKELDGYDKEAIVVRPERAYAIARKR